MPSPSLKLFFFFRKESGVVFVYNYGSSVANPISILSLESLVNPRGREFPSIKMAGPHFTYTSNWLIVFLLGHFLFHFIPALIADIALLASGRKSQYVY